MDGLQNFHPRVERKFLIKSVAAALPTYVMSCFRLPKNLTAKLTSAMAQFWWSSNVSQRRLHWLSWKKLCRDKSEGGLGLQMIGDFNIDLLAKQLWHLIEHLESLFAVFWGRYYRNSHPLEKIKSYTTSYGWKSTVSARYL